jgi:hypothetical protein
MIIEGSDQTIIALPPWGMIGIGNEETHKGFGSRFNSMPILEEPSVGKSTPPPKLARV